MMEGVAVEQVKVIVLPSGLIDRENAAKAVGRTTKTLQEWSRKGIGPRPRSISGRVFYRWDEVQAFMQADAA